MHEGRLSLIFEGDALTEENVMLLATGQERGMRNEE
jgi:hypothetical protein